MTGTRFLRGLQPLVFIACASAILIGWLPDSARAQVWQPAQNVEIITGASPGGGNDRLARVMQKIFQSRKLVAVPVAVVNKPGGGNALSWIYLNQHAGDGHYIALANPNLMTNNITGKSPLTHSEFTPIALLLSEYVSFLVRSDSSLKTSKDLFEQLKREPDAISISVGSALGGANHIALAMIAKSIGADAKKLKTVVFNAQGEAMTALMGGHISAISASASNAVAMLKAGKIRVLGVSSPKRLGGAFADVPTWSEQGVNAVFGNWRAVIGPKGLNSAQIAYWEAAFARLAETQEWQRQADTHLLQNTFLKSAETAAYFDAQRNDLRAILAELGLAK